MSALNARVPLSLRPSLSTYVHIDDLAITLATTNGSRNNNQCVPVYKVPYASLVLGTVTGGRKEVELQGGAEGKNEEQAK